MQLSPLYLEKIQAAERVGEERGEARMIVRLLNRRLGSLPVGEASALSNRFLTQIQQLTVPQLEELGEVLLDFTSLADLEEWLSRDRD